MSKLILADDTLKVIAKILFQGFDVGTNGGVDDLHVGKAVTVALFEQYIVAAHHTIGMGRNQRNPFLSNLVKYHNILHTSSTLDTDKYAVLIAYYGTGLCSVYLILKTRYI